METVKYVILNGIYSKFYLFFFSSFILNIHSVQRYTTQHILYFSIDFPAVIVVAIVEIWNNLKKRRKIKKETCIKIYRNTHLL